ncbi:HNH endonuclease domain-containing protein [Leeuwenhoekiella marinoflava]|uniref:HNH endonuclease domain-containing protein n=1 Tax=Leeuwenhoekiella marinoflava TaxID=988 RepID=UPI003AB93E34
MDHVIPFSVWKNNDLWNLLPAAAHINARKRDKIPAPELIARQRGHIGKCSMSINSNALKRKFRLLF